MENKYYWRRGLRNKQVADPEVWHLRLMGSNRLALCEPVMTSIPVIPVSSSEMFPYNVSDPRIPGWDYHTHGLPTTGSICPRCKELMPFDFVMVCEEALNDPR